MRIIIEDRDDWVLQVRAARSALADGLVEGALYGVTFEGGNSYGVKRNKDSVRVYPQQPTDDSSPDFAATAGLVL